LRESQGIRARRRHKSASPHCLGKLTGWGTAGVGENRGRREFEAHYRGIVSYEEKKSKRNCGERPLELVAGVRKKEGQEAGMTRRKNSSILGKKG